MPEHAACCQGLEVVLFRLRSVVDSCWQEPRAAKQTTRALRYQMELLKGRLAHRELLREAELCAKQQQRAQQFAARVGALVSGGRQSGRRPAMDGGGLVLVEAAALEEARVAASAVQQAIRDEVAVAVRAAEERVHSSWEAAWLKQKAALRRARSRSIALRDRMRSARGLSRRAQALSSRCYRACEPLREARRRGEAPTWDLVAPLMDCVDGVEREVSALGVRAREVFETVALSEAETDIVPPSELRESSPEWQEWEVEASLRRVDAPGEEWAARWRAGWLVAHRPSGRVVRLQAAVRGWIARRQARATVDDEDRGSASEDDEYASAEEEAAEASEGEEEEAREGELELLAVRVGAGARCGAGWPRADARASGDG